MKPALLQALKEIKKENDSKKTEAPKSHPASPPEPQTDHKKVSKMVEERSPSADSNSSAGTAPFNLFKGVCFCFPLKDMDLSPKVIEILKKRINKYGGNVFSVGDKMEDKKCYMYLVSPKVDEEKLRKSVPSEDLYYSCLRFSYINDCISHGSLLPEENYWIKELSEEKPKKKLESSKKKRRGSSEDNLDDEVLVRKPNTKLVDELRERSNSREEERPSTQPTRLVSEQRSNKNKKGEESTIKKSPIKSEQESKDNNKMIIQELKKLQKIYEIEKDKGRVIAYSRAINAIKGLSFDIQSVKDVDNIESIGQKLKDKIKELLETGKLTKVENLQKDEKYVIAQELERVWGIGPTKAMELYNRGIRTIEQLRKNQDLLTKNQKLGLKYLEEIQQKIPRAEVAQIEQRVKEALYQVVGSKKLHKIQACGSYRREKETCGDVDIIITRIDGLFQKDLLVRLVKKLQEIKLVTDNLTMPRQNKGDDESCLNYMGICQLQGKIHRRLDIKYYHYEEFAFALLHFTGSDNFNRSLRLMALKKGYKLSDHTLVPVGEKGGKDKNKAEGAKIICFDQKDIFDFFGLQYKEPKDRDTF